MDPLARAAAEIAEEWGARFAQALEPLVGESVRCETLSATTEDWTRPMLSWRQEFSGTAETAHTVAAPEATWRAVAARVLEAAGLGDVGDEEAQSTYFELLSQAAAGLAQSLSSRAGQEVLCTAARTVTPDSGDGLWVPVRIAAPALDVEPLLVSVTPGLIDVWQVRQPQEQEEAGGAQAVSHYGTLDLLLDVELPVSVSFGRASLRIKDVLKLTTGSVVELDRAITEPVELVVNNCVVARGEVVVVDGNYGVRIAQIMSREERLRSVS